MTKAERDLLMSVAAAIAGFGYDLSDSERKELCDLAFVFQGEQFGRNILDKMRAVAAEQA